MIIQRLEKQNLISPPRWLGDNCVYLTIMGSEAYGVADTQVLKSDTDIYGICIPPKDVVFPFSQTDAIYKFDKAEEFDQWQQHHIVDDKKEYDFSVYSIVRYFRLLTDGNINVLDSIYTPRECVIHSTPIGEMIRQKRQIFLSKANYHKCLGYSYSQIQKAKSTERQGKRKEIYDKFGFDVKFAMHALRLVLQCEQILIEHDLDLRKHKDYLKGVRRGDITYDQVIEIFHQKEKYLEGLYQSSTLRYSPDKVEIKKLLLECLEHHYGSLDKMIVVTGVAENKLRRIQEIISE